MKALTHEFVVGQTLVEIYHHAAVAIADASRGALTDEDVTLILAPAHTGSDLAFRCFELARHWKKNPAQIADAMASSLSPNDVIARWVAAGPYLNIQLRRDAVAPWVLRDVGEAGDTYGHSRRQVDEVMMMEYISPNTNKPLHLGHLRNGVLGRAVTNLIAAQGARTYKSAIVNDRGIHIAKSMLAYERWGGGATPESMGKKGDHFVGGLYVRFNQELGKEKEVWLARQEITAEELEKLDDKEKKKRDERFRDESELLEATYELLRKWEAGDHDVRALWKKMNGWVYDGFDETYEKVGFDFDKIYYESKIYQDGKEIIYDAQERGVLDRAENGAIVAPLSQHTKLQDKVVLRADSTGLYVTQDIHLATIKFKDFGLTKSLYCIGSEQDFYMKQLFAILKLLGFPWADGLFHLSYGMVYLPEGRMKSREGTVVDADDLVAKLSEHAREEISKRHADLDEEGLARRAEAIALAAMTFQLLIVGRETEILFDPKASVRFEGKTGPYLQYTYARVCSILRKAGDWKPPAELQFRDDLEWRIIFQAMLFPSIVADAAEEYDPMLLTNYLFEISQTLNTFLQQLRVLQSQEPVRSSRLAMVAVFRTVLGNGLRLLNIEALEEM